MSYVGLIPRFELNRPLAQEERDYQLHQQQPIDLNGESLITDKAVIRLNSSYLEVVDKFYALKGWLSVFAAFLFCCVSLLLTGLIIITIRRETIPTGDFLPLFTIFLILPAAAIYFFKLVKSEWFAWTHYPIRFNRKTRMVHAYRVDGTVFSAPWDKLFFTMGLHYKPSRAEYYISGHLLAADGETLLETFNLPAYHRVRAQLPRHWEFIRRYMEGDLAQVAAEVEVCLPIEGRRESYHFCLVASMMNFTGALIFIFPIVFPMAFIFSIPRYIAMRTSKVPHWPVEIDAQCPVAADDPYNLSAATNPENLWTHFIRKPNQGKDEDKQ